jgi:hypothetical protein
VQKLDTYFQVNTMIEDKEIEFSALHFDGEAHEWWYHGLVTLGHACYRTNCRLGKARPNPQDGENYGRVYPLSP